MAEVAQDCRDGLFAGTNDVIERITGEPPMTVQTFVSRHRQAFAYGRESLQLFTGWTVRSGAYR